MSDESRKGGLRKHPKHPGWKRMRQSERREVANGRIVVRTTFQQLKRLDERLGVGVGAEKERAKLMAKK